MKQLLQHLDHLMKECLQQHQTREIAQRSAEKAISIVQTLPIQFFASALDCTDPSTLKIRVQVAQTTTLYWLHLLQHFSQPSAPQKIEIVSIKKLENALLYFLHHLKAYYPQWFDLEATMPLQIRVKIAAILLQNFNHWRSQIPANALPKILVSLLTHAVHQAALEHRKMSFQQIFYLQKLLKQVLKIEMSLAAEAYTEKLVEQLLVLNFNHPLFVNYVAETIWNQVNKLEEAADKKRLLYQYQKNMNQLQTHPHYALFANTETCCKTLLKMLEQEILFSQQITQLEQKPKEEKENNLSIQTCLSVSQLALLLRILIQTKMIQYDNQSELIRRVAALMHTQKTPSISAESLRTKYYHPDLAAKNILKEYLILLMNELRK